MLDDYLKRAKWVLSTYVAEVKRISEQNLRVNKENHQSRKLTMFSQPHTEGMLGVVMNAKDNGPYGETCKLDASQPRESLNDH